MRHSPIPIVLEGGVTDDNTVFESLNERVYIRLFVSGDVWGLVHLLVFFGEGPVTTTPIICRDDKCTPV